MVHRTSIAYSYFARWYAHVRELSGQTEGSAHGSPQAASTLDARCCAACYSGQAPFGAGELLRGCASCAGGAPRRGSATPFITPVLPCIASVFPTILTAFTPILTPLHAGGLGFRVGANCRER
jgi:hypothetical protein